MLRSVIKSIKLGGLGGWGGVGTESVMKCAAWILWSLEFFCKYLETILPYGKNTACVLGRSAGQYVQGSRRCFLWASHDTEKRCRKIQFFFIVTTVGTTI